MHAVKVSELMSRNALPNGPGPFTDRSRSTLQAFVPAQMPASWEDVEDRHASLEAHLRESIAWQVRINREERGLKQRELAERAGTKQSAVSKIEDPDGGDVRLSSLVHIAHGFDCALLVRFVSYSEFAGTIAMPKPDRLFACSYQYERAPLTQTVTPATQTVSIDD